MLFQKKPLVTTIMTVISLTACATTLAEDEKVDDEIVVIGSAEPIQKFKLGSSINVVDREGIENLGIQYAADIFRHIPGVAVNRTGGQGGLTQLRLRGAEGNHVLVLIDGIEVAPAGGGGFDFASLLAEDIEKIEVLRGPQSGLYGSNATAGVISITTKGGTRSPELNFGLEAGSDSSRQISTSVAGGNEMLSGRLNIIYRESEFDISTDDSVIGEEKDKDELTTISGSAKLTLNDSLSFDTNVRYNDNDTELDDFDFSGGPLQGLVIDSDSRSEDKDLSAGLSANLSLLDGQSLSKFSVDYTDNETNAFFGSPSGNESSRLKYFAQTTWVFNPVGVLAQRSTVFIEREEEKFRNTEPNDPSQIPEQERNLTGFGLEHRADIGESVFLSGVVRRDNNDAFKDATTYSLSAAYLVQAFGTRIHASYGTGVTNPSFSQQFGFTPGRFTGNRNLTPEKSTSWDIGVEQTLLDGNLVFDITYFDAVLEDEIIPTFLTDVNLSSSINSEGDSDRQGVELSISYQAADAFSLTGAYTYTDATEPGGREVRRPRHIASLNATYTFLDDKARLSTNVVYNGEMLDNDFRNFFVNNSAERTELDAYTVVNLNASYQASKLLELYARVDNLFDEEYEEVISYQTPGLGAHLGFRVTLK